MEEVDFDFQSSPHNHKSIHFRWMRKTHDPIALQLWILLLLLILGSVNTFLLKNVLLRTTRSLAIAANPDSFRSTFDNNIAFYCFDEAIIHVRGGSGGHGSNSFKFGKGRQHLGPHGGAGGAGGNILIKVDSSLNTLRKFRHHKSFRAEDGADGGGEFANGLNAKSFVITVPRGTIVKDNSTNEILGTLQYSHDSLLVSKGGLAGKGNASLRAKGEKMGCTPPEGGVRRWLKLELQLLADIGLIGVPNAGKSTLLKALTNARPKIANYAFTTLVPNLGMCYLHSGSDHTDSNDGKSDMAMMLADIPGLIEGASLGTGLGIAFLKHVEKCAILIHIVNGDSPNPVQEYLTINAELIAYSEILANKPQIVVLNKLDLPEVQAKEKELITSLKAVMPHERLLVISANSGLGVEELKWKTWYFLQKVKNSVAVAAPSIPTNEGDDDNKVRYAFILFVCVCVCLCEIFANIWLSGFPFTYTMECRRVNLQ